MHISSRVLKGKMEGIMTLVAEWLSLVEMKALQSVCMLLQQISDHSSFSFLLLFVRDRKFDHFEPFLFSFSHFTHSFCSTYLSFLSQWSPLRPFLQRFLSTFLVGERCPTYLAKSDRRHLRMAVAIGILVFRAILCPAISLVSRSRHV